jgi:6-phosphogluconolactonase (cycloisomerase 2 family)
MRKRWTYGLLWLLLAILGGCGSGYRPPVIPPPASGGGGTVTVAVLPANVNLFTSTTQQFTSTVTNAANTAVTWQVGGVTGGNETLGTISANGLYTAPATLPAQADVQIKAIAAADPNAVGTAKVTLSSPPPPPKAAFVYVSSGPDDNIQIFSVSGGTPHALSTLSVGAGKNPVALAIHPTGKFLYSLNRGTSDISIFAINTDTGDLTPSGTIATPDGPYAMLFSSTGTYAYVSCDNAAVVSAFALDINTGALSPLNGSPYTLSGKPQGLATSPDGNFLYVTNSAANNIFGFAISPDGTLAAIAGSPFNAGAGVASIVTASGGATDYAYAANRDAGSITSYTLDRSNGTLTSFSEISSGGNSPELFSTASTGFLLGVNSGSSNFFSFELDGELYSYTGPVTTGTQPHPGGVLSNNIYYPWVYILNRDSVTSAASISSYYVYYDGVSNSPLATVPTASNNPTGFAITP